MDSRTGCIKAKVSLSLALVSIARLGSIEAFESVAAEFGKILFGICLIEAVVPSDVLHLGACIISRRLGYLIFLVPRVGRPFGRVGGTEAGK